MPFLTLDLPSVYSLKPRIISRGFTVNIEKEKRVVAGKVWHSQLSSGMRPLLLIGHGETEDKDSVFVHDFMKLMCGKYGFVVATIDGPIHGDRRIGTNDPSLVQSEFDQYWVDNEESITSMVLDWKLTLDALCELPEVDARCIGYFGMSMGTAYGLEFVANDLRISAATFGQWGTQRLHKDRILKAANRINCPVEFYAYEKDSNLSYQKELFAGIKSNEKSWFTYSKSKFTSNSKTIEQMSNFFVVQILDRFLY
jgi:pimeloyl-ACP methyl ester carboxylesterase